MEKSTKSIRWKLLICTAVISTSLFMFEVILSRVYSVILSYHYVFMVVSIAVLGMGLGSIIEYFYRMKDHSVISTDDKIGKVMLQLIIAMIGAFTLAYGLPYMPIIIYMGISLIPYILAGRLLAMIFTSYGDYGDKLYFADLGGAGIAAVGSITLLNWIGFIPTVAIVFVLMFLSLFIWNIQTTKKKYLVISIVGMLTFEMISLIPNISNAIAQNFTGYLTSPKTSLERLRNADTDHEIIYTKWDGFARTDVIDVSDEEDTRIVTIDGRANALMMEWDGKTNQIPRLTEGIDFAPYIIGDNKDVAVVGAGGGKDVLQAILGGAKSVDAIEINKSAIDAVNEMGEFNGDLYKHPQVTVINGDGRSVIAKSNKLYDVIFLSLIMTEKSEALSYAMAESYIYTEEAVKTYYDHLKPEGKLVFISHTQDEMIKVSNTAVKVMQNSNVPVKEIKDRMIVGASVMEHNNNRMIHTPIIMIKKAKYTQDEITKVQKYFETYHYGLLHLPGVYEDNFYGDISAGRITLEEVIQLSPQNIAPATDEKPFFYDYDKGIPDSFIGIIVIILGFVVLFFTGPIMKQRAGRYSIHFAMLGVVFMLVEVAIIQKMTLFLEHPTLAFVISTSALLIGGGIGSYNSSRKRLIDRKNRHIGALGAAISLSATTLFVKFLMGSMLGLILWQKILIVVCILLINGLFMGMIFPYSLKKIKEIGQDKTIPLVYGVNGVFSVLGSLLATILSMQLGISATLVFGIIIYSTVYLMMPILLENN